MKGDLGGLLRKNSIARKLAASITLLILVLACVVAAIFFTIFYNMVLDNQEKKLELRTGNVATTMEDSIIKLQERPELGLKETRRLLSSVVTITEDDVWIVAANGQVEMRNHRKPEGIDINYIKGQIDGDMRGEKTKLHSSYIGYASVKNLDVSFQEMIRAGFRGEHALRKDYDSKMGEMMLTASAPVYGSDGKAVAVLLLRTPTHGFSQGIKSGLLLFFCCSLGALFLAMAAAGLLAVKFTVPLKKMEKMTESFAHGNLHARCGVSRTDEIGKLAAALDEMAEKTAAAKEVQEAFYRNITHDLKTPVIIIDDTVSIMRQKLETVNFCSKKDAENFASGLERIEHNSETLLHRVKSILDCAKAPYKKDWEVRMENLDLILLQAVRDGLLYSESRRAGVGFRLELPGENALPDVYTLSDKAACEELFSLEDGGFAGKRSPEVSTFFMCNKEKIMDMLQNFITNAVKVSPAGTKILIRLRDKKISIRDFGSGISKAEMSKIFTVGYTTGSDGNGFGMHSARIFAEMHNIGIEVESPVVKENAVVAACENREYTGNEKSPKKIKGREKNEVNEVNGVNGVNEDNKVNKVNEVNEVDEVDEVNEVDEVDEVNEDIKDVDGRDDSEKICSVNRLKLAINGVDAVTTEEMAADYVGGGTEIRLILPAEDCFTSENLRLPIEEYVTERTYFDDISDCRLLKPEYVQECDMAEILSVVCKSMEAEAHRKQLAISRVIKGEGLTVKGDPRKLAMMLRNILDNAIKYSLPGSEDEKNIVEAVLDSEKAVIIIRDGGIGIAKEALQTGSDGRAAIWEKFYADRHRIFNPYGMGRGLYEVELIGEIHELFFTVRAWKPEEEYCGTEFIIEFSL